MKNITLRGIVETAGIISVVASLIFVGMQLRQDQDIALANQYHARAETSISNYRSRMESEAYVSAFAKIRAGDQADLTPEEDLRLTFHMRRSMTNMQWAFGERTRAQLPLENWLRQLSEPYRRNYWESEKDTFDPEFVEFLDDLLSK